MRANRYSTSVFTLRSATAYTVPPRPPSPPLGPPLGMYFSLRNAAMPSPPLPACTSMMASSMNFMGASGYGTEDAGRVPQTKKPYRGDRAFRRSGEAASGRLDDHRRTVLRALGG